MTIDGAQLDRLKKEYCREAMLAAGVLAAVHAVPKPQTLELYRFVLTAAYFAALLRLSWLLTAGFHPYYRAIYLWKYQDCGPALESSILSYLHSLEKASRLPSAALVALIAALAADRLALWLTPLSFLVSLANLTFWLALVSLLVYPFVCRSLIAACLQKRSLLSESLALSKFRPRDLAEPAPESPRPEAAVIHTGPYRFRAGGFEWRWQDFFKNGVVFGQAGTGKTACVLNALLDGLLSSAREAERLPAGLILDPKGDYLEKIRILCRRNGREADLLVLDPSEPGRTIRWNPFDSDDDVLQIAGRFAAVLQSSGMRGGEDSFWIDAAKKFIAHAIDLIRLTNAPGQPPSFADIRALACSPGAISKRAQQLEDGDSRGDLCLSFFANEWTELAPETRSSVQAHITNMLDGFVREPYASVFSGRSSIQMSDAIERGKILYVHMPVAEREDMAITICTFIKLAFYREVLRHKDKARPSFFVCDEFQSFFTTLRGFGDSDFFERSRQSNHANIVATQNLPALLKQTDKEHPVNNLLGNCAIKLFLRNTDGQTNEYASKLFGQELVSLGSSSLSGAPGFRGSSGGQSSISMSHQYDQSVRSEAFTELAVPEPSEGLRYAETMLHLASRGRILQQKLKWPLYPITGSESHPLRKEEAYRCSGS